MSPPAPRAPGPRGPGLKTRHARLPVDIREVVDAAATKPYGFMRFDPGPGMGGHCLPVDPFYLSWRARRFGISTELIELAGKVNQRMPYHCVSKATRALNDLGRPVNGSKIALFGVSYKPGVGDVRESPAPEIIELLAGLGADLVYHDPHVPVPPEMGLQSVSVEEALHGADLAVIVTAHPGVDHTLIAQRAPAVVDLHGVLRGAAVGSVVGLSGGGRRGARGGGCPDVGTGRQPLSFGGGG